MTARIATLGMALLFGMSAAPALATDTTVTGRKLLIKDFTRPGQADRKVVFVSRDPIVVPATPGSAGDPTLNGGSLEVHNTAGSGESMTLALPAGNWVLKGDDFYLYRELVDNPPTQEYRIKVIVRSGQVRGLVRDGRGSLISYTLDEPTQGSVGVRVATGADRHCLDFGGIVVADESLDLGGSVYRGRFAAKTAPAPANCGSPSGAFLD
jgi:hypothetical protein